MAEAIFIFSEYLKKSFKKISIAYLVFPYGLTENF